MATTITFSYNPDYDEKEKYLDTPALQTPSVDYSFEAEVDSLTIDALQTHFEYWLRSLGFVLDES